MCGENGPAFLLGLGIATLFFALCVVMPLIIIALRFVKQARRAGGCSECGPPETIFVMRTPNGGYQQVDESTMYAQQMYARGGYPGAYPQRGMYQDEQFVRIPSGQCVSTNVPVAVPVRQPSSVTVAHAEPVPATQGQPVHAGAAVPATQGRPTDVRDAV